MIRAIGRQSGQQRETAQPEHAQRREPAPAQSPHPQCSGHKQGQHDDGAEIASAQDESDREQHRSDDPPGQPPEPAPCVDSGQEGVLTGGDHDPQVEAQGELDELRGLNRTESGDADPVAVAPHAAARTGDVDQKLTQTGQDESGQGESFERAHTGAGDGRHAGQADDSEDEVLEELGDSILALGRHGHRLDGEDHDQAEQEQDEGRQEQGVVGQRGRLAGTGAVAAQDPTPPRPHTAGRRDRLRDPRSSRGRRGGRGPRIRCLSLRGPRGLRRARALRSPGGPLARAGRTRPTDARGVVANRPARPLTCDHGASRPST